MPTDYISLLQTVGGTATELYTKSIDQLLDEIRESK